MLLVGFAIIGWTSYIGRKKNKWLAFFPFITMHGYIYAFDVLVSVPKQFFPEHYIEIYSIFIYIIEMLVFLCLTFGKKRPAFMLRVEEDIESRSLDLKDEAGIWLIGFCLIIFNIMTFGDFDTLPVWIKIYLPVINFILAVVLTAFIINSSYRRYYQNKNLKYQKSLINTMANLVESRDDNTGGHIHRTAKYVEIIARRLQKENKFSDILTDQYIEDMVIAAPLHDVGKIHIPDAILNKPGRLNDEEFAAMKTHSAAGGEIIQQVEEEIGENISYLNIAKEMAEYHHERIDGKGYPHEITEKQIPVCAKILAVADVFDALISKRCYKEPMPLEKAFDIIREESGNHFDAEIAQAFLDSRDEVEQFLNELAEENEMAEAMA